MIMTVIHVITTIELGGAEKQLLITAREQKRNKGEVLVHYIKGNPELQSNFLEVGIEVKTGRIPKSLVSNIISLRALIKSRPGAIVHAHLPRAELISRVALFGLNNPFLISRHNSERFFPKASIHLSRGISLIVSARSFCVIAISRIVKDFLYVSGEISRKSKIEVIPYAFDSTQKVSKKSFPKGSFDKLKLVTIGRLVPQKNYEFLLRSLSGLKSRGVNFSLGVVGVGPLERSLSELSKSLGLDRNIVWLGKQEDVSRILSQHHAFVIASKYEGFGLVLLEAMQAGLPVIAPRHSTFPEVLGEDYPGLFTPDDLTDIMHKLELLSNCEFYECLSSLGNARLNAFTPSKMSRNIQRVYSYCQKN